MLNRLHLMAKCVYVKRTLRGVRCDSMIHKDTGMPAGEEFGYLKPAQRSDESINQIIKRHHPILVLHTAQKQLS